MDNIVILNDDVNYYHKKKVEFISVPNVFI
jgi:hypothetical protein